jgi:RimJ/RimL family protein N-acetyltransferase
MLIRSAVLDDAAAIACINVRAWLEASMACLIDAGRPRVRLWVFEDNSRAQRFYEKAGFRPDGAVFTNTIETTTLNEVRYAFARP